MMVIRKDALDMLALGAVLGGRRDLLDGLKSSVRSDIGKSLLHVIALASEGESGPLYQWFETRLHVTLDGSHDRLIDAILAEMEEAAELDRKANAGFAQWKDAAKALANRRTK